MITRNNFAELVRTLRAEVIENEMEKNHDFILMEAHFFNAGGFATLMSTDYNEELESEARSNGDLFCSKDDFMNLLLETHALEY